MLWMMSEVKFEEIWVMISDKNDYNEVIED